MSAIVAVQRDGNKACKLFVLTVYSIRFTKAGLRTAAVDSRFRGNEGR